MTGAGDPVRTTCPYCGVGCGVLAFADGTIKGDPDHPANRGGLCSKGTALGETVGLEGRLLAPRINGAEASWDSALDLVAQKFSDAVAEHGPDSVAFYVSGQLLTEDYYLANKLMKGYIGSANIDTNSRLCMASSVAGHRRAFGTDTVPGQYEDLELADVVVLVGSNLAWCHPVLHQRLLAARKARPEMRIVCVDPRRTMTAQTADLHLPIRPDGDIALFNHLLSEIARRDLIDRAYVAAHVNGLDDALAAAAIPGDDGLSDADRAAFVDLWCRSEKLVTLYSQGVNQSAFGSDKVNAILNCHLATGRIGRPGMGPLSATGQPNAMGGREVGGLANMLACHLDIENADHRQAVQAFWRCPTISATPGLKAVDLFQACADGRIKALWVMSTNPVVSMPDADAVADAIRAVPFVAVTDILADTDTARLADVLLPASGWGEKSGTVTNSERCISRQRPFLPTPGAARPDWQIIAQVGQKMGWEDAFAYDTPEEVFREYAAMTALAREAGRDLDLTGWQSITTESYDNLPPTVWPVSADSAPGGRFFGGGGFFHPDGRARMLPIKAPALPVHAGLVLNTGRIRDQWHTMTRTSRSAKLNRHMGEPFLELHPTDAAPLGLGDADLCRVSSDYGQAVLRVLISDKVAPGACFAPMHWTARMSSAGRVNALVAPVTDPVSGQPASKMAPVTVQRFAAAWYGFGVSTQTLEPVGEYSALAPIETGWQIECAGSEQPQDWAALARQVLRLEVGETVAVSDAEAGTARVAIRQDGVLVGLFFAARQPVAVARGHVGRVLGRALPVSEALAGVPRGDAPDPGPTVCACMNVGRNTLLAAMAQGAASVDALGAQTGAGTSCGSCRPELQNLLATGTPPALAAE